MINNFSLRNLNLSSTRGFVKMSTSCFSVTTKLNAMFFFLNMVSNEMMLYFNMLRPIMLNRIF